ncbi:hypothetical protein HGA91_04510 [candidate division WWE3 bacterium]|nr:hypothetical protein [candidate division WWE3 bacterium]
MSTPRHDAMIDITTGIFGSGTTTVFRGHVARYRNAAAIPAPFGKIARLAVGDQFEYWQRDQDCPTVLQVIASTQIPGGGQQYAELNTPVSGVDARLVTCDGTAIIVNGIIDHYTHTRVVDAVIVH